VPRAHCTSQTRKDMRRRRQTVWAAQPDDDWLGRASRERTARDAAVRQRMMQAQQQAAHRGAWRPQVETGATRAQHVLRGTMTKAGVE
jgi:hypothetical protein